MPGKGGGGGSRRKPVTGSTPARTYTPSAGLKPAGTKRGKAQRRRAGNEKTPDQVARQQSRLGRRNRRNNP